ncbi:hypothetical protein M501DRAFT_934481 [Patellaria atrata CBS 101060]|uniref:PhoD-like phosphatase domain-containing protein n=1 Tax=Patellaria atrata CBS 101060 TaxID=1346257 RepID=A0A9P4SBF0_9PEZI|nr:hypothetical protein M501DRAFT_934481 [Patellaria atrata CBS 101060]
MDQQPESSNLAHNSNGGYGRGPQIVSTSDQLEVICGPLLNYRHMSDVNSDVPIWHGSVLIVTKPGQVDPQLHLRCLGPIGDAGGSNGTESGEKSRSFEGEKLYEDPNKAFFRFRIDSPIQPYEARWEYTIPKLHVVGSDEEGRKGTQSFVVPSRIQSMRILFHSCNGFSVGTDMDAWKGPSLWNDVLRMHSSKPFHVMIGGGDQIYNDGVRVDGPLKPWTAVHNPQKRRHYPFNEKMRADCDEYYYQNYVRWYNTEPFSAANGQIAQLNIWDDHDIIDGFGSYTDRFMRCGVFRGIGGVAHKYYLLFQHHIAPAKSTFTTDEPNTMADNKEGTSADPNQLHDTFVMKETQEDPSYIIGPKPGPYVEERSRNIYCQLGARIAFAGIDARTERTRHQINYPETYELFFGRIDKELSANKEIKHLILLLGVPIAYPRLQWLENILSSPIIGPIRFLNKRFGIAGGLFNQFDGQVDLLDDLDDHYAAHQHKHERRELVQSLQKLSKERNVRISILSGDVHLAAIGRFYSNPKLKIPAEQDWRYMPNIISSAITNKPPPQAVADLLARRNKIHHLDHDTDETLLEIFDRDPGVINDEGEKVEGIKSKTRSKNHSTMPSRNYAIIAESHDALDIADGRVGNSSSILPANGNSANGESSEHIDIKNPRRPIHSGEQGAGTNHAASNGLKQTGLGGLYGVDVTLRVEISPQDREGKTDGYGFSIPALEAGAYVQQGVTW